MVMRRNGRVLEMKCLMMRGFARPFEFNALPMHIAHTYIIYPQLITGTNIHLPSASKYYHLEPLTWAYGYFMENFFSERNSLKTFKLCTVYRAHPDIHLHTEWYKITHYFEFKKYINFGCCDDVWNYSLSINSNLVWDFYIINKVGE